MTIDFGSLAASPLYRVGSIVAPSRRFEGHRLEVTRSAYDGRVRLAGVEIGSPCGFIDISWLKAASDAYDISSDPRDFVIVELPIVTADVPNRNLDAFPYTELTSFNNLVGRIVYQTLIGKPTFIDHQNKDPKKAKGVIFDAALRGPFEDGVYRVKELAGFDRSKDAQLARAILSGERDGFSMGALAGYVTCSICAHASDGRPQNACRHIIEGKGRLIRSGRAARLVYEQCHAVNFIETSSVADPADITARSRMLLQR